ncbi:hypothetical protein [Streptomyces sparsogenes]|nr:hypothetical protein [Streptomyces sparsogenes]
MPDITFSSSCTAASFRAGGVVVPMNPLLRARDIALTLRDSGPASW